MRFTKVLCQVNYHRHFKRIWKRQGKMEVKEAAISPELCEMKIEIKDAKNILFETKMFKPPIKSAEGLPYPLPPSAFPQKIPYYRMHTDVKVSENENQALTLTKTIPYQGLPKEIKSLIGSDYLPNQDELVQTSILQAQVWDAMQVKLPKLVDPEKPGYVFKRQFGIEHGKKVLGLLEKMSFLCDTATGKYAGCFLRSKISNAFCELGIKRCTFLFAEWQCLKPEQLTRALYDVVFFLRWPNSKGTFLFAEWQCLKPERYMRALYDFEFFLRWPNSKGGSNIVFQMPCDILLKARNPLPRFASVSEVNATEKETVPDIYPIKPTLDLDNCSENPLSNSVVISNAPSSETLHTLFVAQKDYDPWLPSQQLAKAISTCFAFAAVEAQIKFGVDTKVLPEPISIQCMYMDVKSANFLAYQLNTLDLDNDIGVKNQVWIDEGADLYQSVSEVDLITDYNPSIFSKMLALHMNGLHSC